MGQATNDLRHEHEAILHVLGRLDRMMRLQDSREGEMLGRYQEVVHFLKTFADKCHHGKEESGLFPALEAKGVPVAGGPIGVMLREHEEGRELIRTMAQALLDHNLAAFDKAAVEYGNLLRNHIDKENSVLFSLADRLLSEEEQDSLFGRFEEYEETVMGHGVHEQLHAKIKEWEKTFPLLTK